MHVWACQINWIWLRAELKGVFTYVSEALLLLQWSYKTVTVFAVLLSIAECLNVHRLKEHWNILLNSTEIKHKATSCVVQFWLLSLLWHMPYFLWCFKVKVLMLKLGGITQNFVIFFWTDQEVYVTAYWSAKRLLVCTHHWLRKRC